MAASELLDALPDLTRRALVAPGHDLSTRITELPKDGAVRVLLRCAECDFGLTRTVRHRDVAASGRHGRLGQLVELLSPLFVDFADQHGRMVGQTPST